MKDIYIVLIYTVYNMFKVYLLNNSKINKNQIKCGKTFIFKQKYQNTKSFLIFSKFKG